MTKTIDILELFSGTGGFTKGFIDAGYTINKHYFSEIDKHAIANYKYNFKNAESIGSVTDVCGLPTRPTVITFGSPCQDFSLAGKRMGMEGQRSSLITEAIRLIGELRPSVFIWENVKGTFSSNDGQDFWAIIAAFANLGGYRLEWQLLNTSWFLPQNRERIYLVGHLDGHSKPGVFPFGEDGKIPNNQTRGAKPYAKPASAITTKEGWRKENNFVLVPKIADCLTAGGNSGGLHSDMTVITVKSATKEGYEIAQAGDSINFSNPTSETRRGRVGKGVAQTLDTACNQGVIKKHNQIRRLTEIECERLQGFPDDWTKYGIYEKQVWINKKEGTFKIVEGVEEIPKTQRYKMCGNAVTVAVVKAIAERLAIK